MLYPNSNFIKRKIFTVHVCARVAPNRKRAAIFTGSTVDNPKPGLIASKHLTVASTTSSVLKPLRFVILSSMSLKTLIFLRKMKELVIGQNILHS